MTTRPKELTEHRNRKRCDFIIKTYIYLAAEKFLKFNQKHVQFLEASLAYTPDPVVVNITSFFRLMFFGSQSKKLALLSGRLEDKKKVSRSTEVYSISLSEKH